MYQLSRIHYPAGSNLFEYNESSHDVLHIPSFYLIYFQCFGLLGINGAGKTTSFKMITGEIRPSGGAAILMGQM